MGAGWAMVPLGEVLHPAFDPHAVDPVASYPIAGVYGFGRGMIKRPPTTGQEIAASQLFRIKSGQFIYSRLKSFEGAFAVVSDDVDGYFVSNEFPTFDASPSRLDPRYLGWYFKQKNVWQALASDNKGIGARRERLHPDRLLDYEIPLPPLDEQRRIVARIDALAAKIAEARGLREEAEETTASLYPGARHMLYAKLECARHPIGDVFDLINGRAFKPEEWQDRGRKIIRIQNLKYPTVPFNLFVGPVDHKHLVHAGDVLFAWSGQIVSLGAHIWQGEEAILNQHIFNVRARAPMLPRFVAEGFNWLVDEMKAQVRGLEMFHIRKQELNLLGFPVPTEEEQHRIVAELDALQAKVDAVKQLQDETAAELDALLPALLDRAFKGEL